ncbi:MAG: ATP-dependent Clp protease adaptor ClpS [Bacteroidales bacterium]
MAGREKIFTRNKPEIKGDTGEGNMHFLVLHNDDVHTFEYVIECLMEICGHDAMQAEQCTYLVHFKGNCDVLRGGYSQLKPYREAMSEKELKVTID